MKKKKKDLTPAERAALQEEKDRIFYRRVHKLLTGFLRFAFRLKPTGVEENLPPEGACLICANHISAADFISVAAVCRRRVCFLAKKELFAIPIVGWLMRRLGAVRVDRGAADVGAIRKMLALLEAGEAVSVFPQGHRYKGKNPADTPIKDGAGMLAVRAGCPVVPVCIKVKKERYALFRRVDVIYGAPIPPEELIDPALTGRDAYRAASRKIFDRICALGGYEPTAKESKQETENPQ